MLADAVSIPMAMIAKCAFSKAHAKRPSLTASEARCPNQRQQIVDPPVGVAEPVVVALDRPCAPPPTAPTALKAPRGESAAAPPQASQPRELSMVHAWSVFDVGQLFAACQAIIVTVVSQLPFAVT